MDSEVSSSMIPSQVDPTVPSVGRLYDYFLNGIHHFPVDVEAARRVLEVIPETHYLAHANRGFLQRAAGTLARAGIRQFIDIGAGIPTQWNTEAYAKARKKSNPVIARSVSSNFAIGGR
jgi:hypothetical protein